MLPSTQVTQRRRCSENSLVGVLVNKTYRRRTEPQIRSVSSANGRQVSMTGSFRIDFRVRASFWRNARIDALSVGLEREVLSGLQQLHRDPS